MTAQEAYQKLCELIQRADRLKQEGYELDCKTMLGQLETDPSKKVAELTRRAHEITTSDEVGELLGICSGQFPKDSIEAANIQGLDEEYARQRRLSPELVQKLSLATAEVRKKRTDAVRDNDFSKLEEPLHTWLKAKRAEASALGYTEHPYDAGLDRHVPGMTTERLLKLIDSLEPKLKTMRDKAIQSASPKHASAFFQQLNHPPEPQLELARQISFEFLGLNPKMTEIHSIKGGSGLYEIRPDKRCILLGIKNTSPSLLNTVATTFHEGGHALYRQGLNAEHYGLPTGDVASSAMNEGIARYFQLHVASQLPFWKHIYSQPELLETFPALNKTSPEEIVAAMHQVKTEYQRTKADPLTYALIVISQTRVEIGLMDGSILPQDASAYYHALLKTQGIEAPENIQNGFFEPHLFHPDNGPGYRMAYGFADMIAAQLANSMAKDPSISQAKQHRADFRPEATWLQENVFCHGGRYDTDTLLQMATGNPLDVECYVQQLEQTFNIFTSPNASDALLSQEQAPTLVNDLGAKKRRGHNARRRPIPLPMQRSVQARQGEWLVTGFPVSWGDLYGGSSFRRSARVARREQVASSQPRKSYREPE